MKFRRIRYIHTYLLTLSLLFWVVILKAEEAKQSIFDLLNDEAIEQATIEVDLDAITADWRSQDKYRAVLSYKDQSSKKQFWNIKLQLRGKFRRLHCSGIPPLKVFFDKEDLKQAGLAKYDDLKLVNYCFEDEAIAKELLVKEYLAYKMYNELSDASFKVKLLRITYKDTQSNRKWKQWAFFIEDTAQMRDRLEGGKVELAKSIEDNPFDRQQIQQVALFQYMIGNSDWNIVLQKNIKIIERAEKIWAIPYDFDFSGLVNPPYGTASKRLNQTALTDRVYLGPLGEGLEAQIEFFLHKKADLLATIEENKLLKKESKENMLAYVRAFYDNLTASDILSHLPPEDYSQLH